MSRGNARVARVATTRDSPGQHGIDPAVIEIRPEPSPAERAAILMALARMLGTVPRDDAPRVSTWALAGRREALLGRDGGVRTGRGRGFDRLADW